MGSSGSSARESRAEVQPARGFPPAEFAARAARAQASMTDQGLDALVLTCSPNVRYFSGFDTQFWESPTRPWFLVVPRVGEPIAIIPEIGVSGMGATWVCDIRTWPSPRPADDGVSLLAAALAQLPRRYARVGWELGRESVVRMPLVDFERVGGKAPGLQFADGTPIVRKLRAVKSEAEIEKLRYVCGVVSDGFEALASNLRVGESEREPAASSGSTCWPVASMLRPI